MKVEKRVKVEQSESRKRVKERTEGSRTVRRTCIGAAGLCVLLNYKNQWFRKKERRRESERGVSGRKEARIGRKEEIQSKDMKHS